MFLATTARDLESTAEDGEEMVGINFTFAKDRRSSVLVRQHWANRLIMRSALPLGLQELWTINCLGGVVELDARPPTVCSDCNIKPKFLQDSNISKHTEGANRLIKTRLLCNENKASLCSNQGFFAMETRLLCKTMNASLKSSRRSSVSLDNSSVEWDSGNTEVSGLVLNHFR